ncbi:ABC transporter permease [Amycolatopsis pithecellobii]|nr:ABC transporter permease [Amycolatopsis pithecellobii]
MSATKSAGERRDASPGPVDPAGGTPAAGTPVFRRIARYTQVGRLSGLYLWVAVIVFFAIEIPETFLTQTTVQGIIGNQAVTVIVATGALIALTSGCFDLSVGQNLGMSAVFLGWFSVNAHLSPGIAIVLTLLIGAAVGAVNAILVVVIGIDSFIVTLGMSSVLFAITQIVSDQHYIGPLPKALQDFTNWQQWGLSGYDYYAIACAIICWMVLEHTAAGRRSAATGANKAAARLVGIATGRHQAIGLIACATLAGFAGILVAGKVGTISPTIGPEYLLPAYAACFLSATQLKPGRFNVWGMVLALFLLGTGATGLQLLGGQGWVGDMFTGVALIIAVGFAVVTQRRRKSA